MRIVDLLKISFSTLIFLHENGIKVSDVLYIGLFDDYQKMRSEGYKVSYIVYALAENYNICERKVYKILRRFQTECQFRSL